MYTFSGVRNQSMFSLLSVTVLIFSRCLTPTFSDTEFPPQLPQPSVSEGIIRKLYRSPMPPWEDGVFTTMRQVFIRAAKASSTSCFFWVLIYREAVWP